jgi:hypothetical protein
VAHKYPPKSSKVTLGNTVVIQEILEVQNFMRFSSNVLRAKCPGRCKAGLGISAYLDECLSQGWSSNNCPTANQVQCEKRILSEKIRSEEEDRACKCFRRRCV